MRLHRHATPFRATRRIATLLAALALSLPCLSHAADDDLMRDSLAAARDQAWERIDFGAIESHPLAGYVEYHRLRHQLPQLEPQRVLEFIERHADSPLSEWMRGQAITRYGRAGRYDSLLAVADGAPTGAERRCYYYTAQLGSDPAAAAEGGLALWMTGSSRPGACDTLFDVLRSQGVIGEAQIWARKMLAWQAGESGLAAYLGRMLGSRWEGARAAMRQLDRDPAAITRTPTCLGPECQASGPLFAAAMHGFTRADTAAALAAWRDIGAQLPETDEHSAAIERDLLFYALVRDVQGSRDWVDRTLAGRSDADLLELRIRAALADRDWEGVLEWLARLDATTRDNSRWHYWAGRAHEQLGHRERAQRDYALAAEGRNFFGFAAADRLGIPYTLNLERHRFDDAYRQQMAAWPVVERTEALLRIDEPGLAAREWYAGVARASEREAHAMADYARHREWYAKLVQTTITGGMWNALEWRFPEAYREHFLHWGQMTGVDPYLLMGIARRESAYNVEAVSPAGARGLMQLMPGTATQLARQLGIRDPGRHGVLDPELNIRLGSTYIRDMLERYSGNRLAAAAAYNAGPSRVDRWLADGGAESFDLFVESIPFRETRLYVQAVLSYRVIFESLANGGSSEGVSLLSPAERTAPYDRSLVRR